MNDATANGECESAAPTTGGDTAEPLAIVRQARRFRTAKLLHSVALLSTTALLATLDPKNPPFRGD